jgi:hypothetical protein
MHRPVKNEEIEEEQHATHRRADDGDAGDHYWGRNSVLSLLLAQRR